MWSSEREISVAQLQRGMFVARLDRPWLGTSFPVQGFYIQNDEDVEKIRNYCTHVYIDVYKSQSPAVLKSKTQALKQKKDNKIKHKNMPAGAAKQLLSRLAIEKYHITSSFKQEVQHALPVLGHLEGEVHNLMSPRGYLNKPIFQQVHNSTSDLVESMIRNPDAMVWLCRVQRNNSMVYQHVLRLAILGCLVGRQLGLNRFLLVDLTMALLMTGIGKSMLEAKTLNAYRHNSSPKAYKQHVQLTLGQLQNCQLPGVNLVDIVANYCERVDGSGYPHAKTGKNIPLLARIAGLIEYFEIQVNPFDKGVAASPSDAIYQLNSVKGKLFDEVLVEKFVTAIGIYPTGSLVELNDDRVGIVCSQTYEKRLRASIIPLTSRCGDHIDDFKVIDLNIPNQWQLSDAKLRIRRGLPINTLPRSLIESAHHWLFKQNYGVWGKVKNIITS